MLHVVHLASFLHLISACHKNTQFIFCVILIQCTDSIAYQSFANAHRKNKTKREIYFKKKRRNNSVKVKTDKFPYRVNLMSKPLFSCFSGGCYHSNPCVQQYINRANFRAHKSNVNATTGKNLPLKTTPQFQAMKNKSQDLI